MGFGQKNLRKSAEDSIPFLLLVFSTIFSNGKQCPLVVTFEPLAHAWHVKMQCPAIIHYSGFGLDNWNYFLSENEGIFFLVRIYTYLTPFIPGIIFNIKPGLELTVAADDNSTNSKI